jgi:hypothetical protein
VELFETRFTIDKITSKKIRKTIVSPFVKKAYLLLFIMLVWMLSIAIFGCNSFARNVILLIIPVLLCSRYIGNTHGRIGMFLRKVKKKRRKISIESKEYEFKTLLKNDCIEVKDVIEYEDNSIMKINYSSINWLIESEMYYLILPKMKIGSCSWRVPFGVIDKVIINGTGNREKFLDYIITKCPDIKLILLDLEMYIEESKNQRDD